MGWIGELITAAGPFGGWVVSGLLGTSLLYMYATDRIVSAGRHAEQAEHFRERIDKIESEVEQYRSDRDYWRDTALNLMETVAAATGKDRP